MNSLRAKALEILGGKCSNPRCLVPGGCRDERCLQIDHIRGDGNIDRRSQTEKYHFIIDNPWNARREYQILCANCNWIKRIEMDENATLERRDTKLKAPLSRSDAEWSLLDIGRIMFIKNHQ